MNVLRWYLHAPNSMTAYMVNKFTLKPPVTSNYPQQVYLHSSCKIAAHDAKNAEIQLHNQIQESETDVPCGDALTLPWNMSE